MKIHNDVTYRQSFESGLTKGALKKLNNAVKDVPDLAEAVQKQIKDIPTWDNGTPYNSIIDIKKKRSGTAKNEYYKVKNYSISFYVKNKKMPEYRIGDYVNLTDMQSLTLKDKSSSEINKSLIERFLELTKENYLYSQKYAPKAATNEKRFLMPLFN